MAVRLEYEYMSHSIRFICQGSSGAIFAALVSQHIIKHCRTIRVHEIIHIKKPGEESHYPGHYITGQTGVNKNIIIDDFISTGRTIARIYDTFLSCNPKEKMDAIIVAGYYSNSQGADHMNHIRVDKLICGGSYDITI